MTTQLSGTAGVIFPDNSAQNTAATGFGFKNRIINGSMIFDQRNIGVVTTPTVNATYTLDRWRAGLSVASKYSVQQGSASNPIGFSSAMLVTSLSSYSITSTDYFSMQQRIEGYNIADLGWGASGASAVTLSFWVRSSLTGTFGGSLQNSAGDRSYPFSYTISSVSTWEYKTITIPGDTTGTWLTTNGIGIIVSFSLGMGSTFSNTAGAWAAGNYLSSTSATSVVGTNGATFILTGVQLEKGSTATAFDVRSIGTELALCQRYYERSYDIGTANGALGATGNRLASNAAAFTNSSSVRSFIMGGSFAVTKRGSPTLTFYSATGGAAGYISGYSSAIDYAVTGWTGYGTTTLGIYITTSASPSTAEISTFQFTAAAEL